MKFMTKIIFKYQLIIELILYLLILIPILFAFRSVMKSMPSRENPQTEKNKDIQK